jgi:hypothetical protein
MIYIFSQGANNKPSGGVKVLFDIVKTLNDHKMESSLLINGGEYSPQWFSENNIPIESDIYKVTENDVVVFHEEALWAFERIKLSNCKHIILNQGAHWSLTNYLGYERTKQIYENSLGVIANSDYTMKLVRRLFGHNFLLKRFHIGIEPYFTPGNKQNVITYMPRRNSETAECIVQYVQGKHKQWTCLALDNMSHEHVANALASSKLFLSFGGPEGFGMPPLEAMLSGCHVVGFDGFGGEEYFKPPLFIPVPFMDLMAFLSAVDFKIQQLGNNNQLHYGLTQHYLKDLYSKKTFTQEIITIFKELLNR